MMVVLVNAGAPRGRGSGLNPENRFDSLHLDLDPGEADGRGARTEFFHDDSQSILARNSSEDLSFDASLNPYRGCEHGCAYCYARPYHEYLGFSAGLDFESKILVKKNAAALLEKELSSARYKPQTIAISGVTDAYQPVERRLGITRGCLEVLARYRNPVGIVTKNALVTRDLDHLTELAKYGAVVVFLSITTLDKDLARILEPRAASPRARLEAITQLREAGVPVGVGTAPMIPGLNDHEVAGILEAASEAGAGFAFYTMVRLPGAVAPVFEDWLERHFPDRREKVMNRIRGSHDGNLNDLRPGDRMRGTGAHAEQLRQLFQATLRRCGMDRGAPELSTAHFRRLLPGQGELF